MVVTDAWSEDSLGQRVCNNLIAAGQIEVAASQSGNTSSKTFRLPSDGAVPAHAELALLCLPADLTVQALIDLSRQGTKAAIVMAQDPGGSGPDTTFKLALRAAATEYGIRFLGPSSAGLQRPNSQLNASRFRLMPADGGIAMISQSASITAGTLAWAHERNIGFASVIALGESADLEVSDAIDEVAVCERSRMVLLVLSNISDGRRFLSSVRAMARFKPVIVLWTGQTLPEQSPTSRIDHDAVSRAAFARAGLVTVSHVGEWYDTVTGLVSVGRLRGERLIVMTNGIGSAQLLSAQLGAHHRLTPIEVAIEPPQGPYRPDLRANPIDLGVDAQAADYANTLAQINASRAADAVLVIVSPTNSDNGEEIAGAIAEAGRGSAQVIIVCWMGLELSAQARSALAASGIAVYDEPHGAGQAWRSMLRFRRSQAALNVLPQSVHTVNDARRSELVRTDDSESAAFLSAYGIVSASILGNQTHLNPAECQTVLAAFGVGACAPGQTQPGQAIPLQIRIDNDPGFGRVMEARVGSRRHTLLPALNAELATGAAAELHGELGLLGIDGISTDQIVDRLVKISDMLVALPEIIGGHIDGFVTLGQEPVACKAQLQVRIVDRESIHLALHPYPSHTESLITLKDGSTALIRPLQPHQDLPLLRELIEAVGEEDRFMRFVRVMHDPTIELARMLRTDYDREMMFVALGSRAGGTSLALGIVEAQIFPGHTRAEFSVLLRSDLKGTGLGRQLMEQMIAYTRQKGVQTLFGEVLKKNRPMRALATRLGFDTETDPDDDDMVRVSLGLNPQ
jgi:acyl-CoA synthetase (NDP forming)/GNAT superfamily N-acetyltransferase